MEIYKDIFITIISVVIGGGVSYYYWLRSTSTTERKEKKMVLNTVLSNLLSGHHNLQRMLLAIDMLISDEEHPITIPKKLIHKGLISRELSELDTFTDLEVSIENIQKYDPILFQCLRGLGKKIQSLKTNVFSPFVIAIQENYNPNYIVIRMQVNDSIKEIEDAVKLILDEIKDKNTTIRALELLKFDNKAEINEMHEDLHKYINELIIQMIPKNIIQEIGIENIPNIWNDPDFITITSDAMKVLETINLDEGNLTHVLSKLTTSSTLDVNEIT